MYASEVFTRAMNCDFTFYISETNVENWTCTSIKQLTDNNEQVKYNLALVQE
jgi:hypothetical protein